MPPSARGSVWCRCTTHKTCITDSEDSLFPFSPATEFWTWRTAAPHRTSPWHFLFTLYASDFRFTSVSASLFIYFYISCFLSCGMHQPERWGKLRSVLAAPHPAEKGAGFDFTWSKKPLTCVTLHSGEVKMKRLGKNLYATTDKMSNNDVLERRLHFNIFNVRNMTRHFIITCAVFTRHVMSRNLQYYQ